MSRLLTHRWTVLPVVALVVLALAWGRSPGGLVALAVATVLASAVLSSVHHAEVLAHRFGEPFGSLLLAVAVTVIEVGLIITLTVGQAGASSVARDTVFAAFMIATNGIVGASLLAATLRGRVAVFNAEGSGAMLATLTAIAVLCLVLPNFTSSSPGPTYSTGQLLFVAVAALSLYALFVFVQTVRHREHFEPVEGAPVTPHAALRPTGRGVLASALLLVVALVAVVGLAKVLSPALESAVLEAGLPITTVGVLIAAMVLMPEAITAVLAARADNDDVQRSFNLAYGSAMASIGLTIPVVAVISIATDSTLLLGLSSANTLLLALTVAVSVLTVTPGRATLLQAGVHLTTCAAFLAVAVMP
ncbi:MAG TPA: hypothetical protein VF143_07600 [Candidatus Nanopelagicales bacterium]